MAGMIKTGEAGLAALASEGTLEVCSVRAGDTLFGVPIMRVLEILGRQSVQAVPLAPAYIGGLVHYRGEVLTAVSLRQLLRLPHREGLSDVLVFEGAAGGPADGEEKDGYFGLMVDSVGEVSTVRAEDFEANPSTLEDHQKALFAGTYKLDGSLLVMLDPERFAPERLAAGEGQG